MENLKILIVYQRFQSIYKTMLSYWSVEKLQKVQTQNLQRQKKCRITLSSKFVW